MKNWKEIIRELKEVNLHHLTTDELKELDSYLNQQKYQVAQQINNRGWKY